MQFQKDPQSIEPNSVAKLMDQLEECQEMLIRASLEDPDIISLLVGDVLNLCAILAGDRD